MYKLDELSELYTKRDVQRANHDAEVNAVLNLVRDQLEAIDARWADRLKETNDAIAALESDVKREVLQDCQTIKGTHLQAVYVRGRASWDGKALDGFAAAHPEILPFKKVGEPSVTIRAVS
jgi:hypothetical protein